MSSHEWTALYGIVAEHYPHFVQEIEDYLKYGLLEHGFLRVHLDAVTHGTRRQLQVGRRAASDCAPAMDMQASRARVRQARDGRVDCRIAVLPADRTNRTYVA